MDIPTFPYGRDQNVTRAVYDDGACVDTWRGLVSNVSNERLVAYNTSDLQMLADEVVSSLKYMFTNITIPYPTYLHGKMQNTVTVNYSFTMSFLHYRFCARKCVALSTSNF